MSVAMEHARIGRVLLDAVSVRPNITVLEGARITDAKLNGAETCATVWRNGHKLELWAPLFVSAEGRGSKMLKDIA